MVPPGTDPPQGTATPSPSPHRAPLEALGITGPPLGRLIAYLDTLAEWSRKVNLTAARTPLDRVRILVEPVLPLCWLPAAGTLLDVGSGNGSPGLVLASLRADLEVTLLEPRARRWAFLREAVRRTGSPPVRVLRGRHDDFPGPPARNVTVRALALPLAALAPLIEPGGRLLVLGGRPRLEGPFVEDKDPGAPAQVRIFRRLPEGVSRGTPPGAAVPEGQADRPRRRST